MRKYSLFNFLEKKIYSADTSPVAVETLKELSFRELALHIAISYIANTLSKCEIKTYKDGEEVREKLYYMLNVSPNANENSSQFINKFIERYYYNGEALLVPHNDTILCADGFDVDETNPLKEFLYYNVTFGTYQPKRKYKASEVFHLKLDNQNVRSLVDLIYMQYGEVMNLALQTFKRTNGRKYKLILEQYRAGDPDFAETFNNVIRDQLKTFIENDNAVYPQFKGMDLQEFGDAAPTDSGDIIAIRKEVFETTAQAFKVPIPMLYGNMTNIKELTTQFLTFCIDPLADMIGEELSRKYYTYEEWKRGNKIVVDTTCVSHVDILDAAASVDKLISSGILCVDELRNLIGYNPLNSDFSRRHFMTKNYEPAENALVRSDE